MADISGYLNNIKSAESGETVRDSIIQCLNKINNDNPNKTKPLNVTANGTYTSETGYSYNPVTVNVPSGGASGYTFEELEVTENGEYEPDEENKMFNKVTVNVPQLAKDLAPDGYTITQNGEYDPLLDGYDGYGKIIVNVNEATGEGPFTVQFYDKPVTDPTAAVIETQTVAKGGSVEFQGVKPTSSLGGFVGWSPSPTNVTRDLKCYPNFAQIIVDPTEIQDSWEVICANGGAPYPIGAHKLLPYGASLTPEEIRKYTTWDRSDNYDLNIYMMMYKVAEGEGNSHSTWLGTHVEFHDLGNDAKNWENNNIRKFLNEAFFDHMVDIFKNSIVPVTKYSVYLDQAPHPTQDKVWIPNFSEISSWQTGLDEAGIYDFANTTSEGSFVPTGGDGKMWYEAVTRADASSMKYVREYLNNDRNWPLLFTQSWDGLTNPNYFICVRDARGTDATANIGYAMAYNNSIQYIQTKPMAWYRVNRYNLGFCL